MQFVFSSLAMRPVSRGYVNHGDVLPPHRLDIVCHILGRAVVVEHSLVVDPRHRLLSLSHIEVDEVPVGTAANPFLLFDKWQVVLNILLLILNTEIECLGRIGVQAAVASRSPFADDHGS